MTASPRPSGLWDTSSCKTFCNPSSNSKRGSPGLNTERAHGKPETCRLRPNQGASTQPVQSGIKAGLAGPAWFGIVEAQPAECHRATEVGVELTSGFAASLRCRKAVKDSRYGEEQAMATVQMSNIGT